MNKEDYMRLPKERLAELLVEKDTTIKNLMLLNMASAPSPASIPDCYHGGPCINPFHDCVNCPHLDSSEYNINTTSTGLTPNKDK